MVPGLPNSPTIAHSVYKYGYKTTYNSFNNCDLSNLNATIIV